MTRPLALAVVGGGPRCTGVLAALGRLAPQLHVAAPGGLVVHVVDEWPDGAGSVWRADQDRHLLANSWSDQISLAESAGDIVCGTFADFAARRGGDTGWFFPTRRAVGEYLRHVHRVVRSRLPELVTVVDHRGRAAALGPVAGRTRVELDIGETTEPSRTIVVDAVILATGNGLVEPRCVLPGGDDADVAAAPAGQRVLVQGMGLTCFDVLSRLTESRGGTFTRDAGGRLQHRPGGAEPRVLLTSRTGLLAQPKLRPPAGDAPARPSPASVRRVHHELRAASTDTERLRQLTRWLAGHLRRGGAAAGRVDEFLLPLTALGEPSVRASADRIHRGHAAAVARRAASVRHPGQANGLAAMQQYTVAALDAVAAGAAELGTVRALERAAGRLTSGPPPLRLEQLDAMVRSGMVTFCGARERVWATDDEWHLRTAHHSTVLSAACFIDARVPAAPVPVVWEGPADSAWTVRDDGTLAVDPVTYACVFPGRPDDTCPAPVVHAVGQSASAGAVGSLPRPGGEDAFAQQNTALVDAVLTAWTRAARSGGNGQRVGGPERARPPLTTLYTP